MNSINDRVKLLRKALNLSQEELGTRIGITRASISNIEKGTRNMSEQTVKSMCREYNVSECWLRTGEGEMFNEPDVMILEKIDDIMSGENEFRKNLVKTIVNFSDEELLLLERIVNKLNSEE